MYSCLFTRAIVGVDSLQVKVEVHISSGLPSFSLVGLPATAVKESKDRVRSAILNTGFKFPNQRVTVNLAPADLPKDGGRYDLAIAIAILCATGQLTANNLNQIEFFGELSLAGDLCSVSGLLPVILACKKHNKILCLPSVNQQEASLISGVKILPCDNLAEVCQALIEQNPIEPTQPNQLPTDFLYPLDMADVKGQYTAKRALEIAAAGRHHMLMVGPPGTGKTMLAMRLSSILPALSEEQAIEIATIESVAGMQCDSKNFRAVRLRSPHHSLSSVALTGGGSRPKPGEISLAHNGILFLDELAEFRTDALENLREPLESGVVHISRANARVSYPSKFQLVAALNPKINKYSKDDDNFFGTKISKPLLDRIDIQINVPRLKKDELLEKNTQQENSASIRQRVENARDIQNKRGFLNVDITPKHIDEICELGAAEINLIKSAIDKLALSPRSYHKTLKVARTIADLANAEKVSTAHIAEAIGYRINN